MELDARVPRAVGPDITDDAHDRVLHGHALAGPSRERDLDRFRDTQPGAPERERHGDIRRAHTRAERADRSVRVRMRVAADDHGAGLAVPLFDHDLVAHALTGVVEGRDALRSNPFAQDPVRIGDDRRRRGRGVVDEHGDFGRVPHLLLAKIPQPRDDRVDDGVVDHHARHRRDDEIAGLRVPRRDAREDLLGESLRQRPTPEAASRADPSTGGRSRRAS